MNKITLYLIGSLLLAPNVVALQLEIGAMGNYAWTRDERTGQPHGFSLYLMPSLSHSSQLKFEYGYYRSTRRSVGYEYEGWGVYKTSDVIPSYKRVNTLGCLSLGVLHNLCGTRTTFLDVGGGLCAAVIGRHIRNLATGSTWHSDDRLLVGLNFEFSILVNELKDIPLVMRIGFSHKFLTQFIGSVAYGGSNTAEHLTITEVKWGFAYPIGRPSPDKQ